MIKHFAFNVINNFADSGARTKIACGLSGYRREQVTRESSEVTCKACKNTVAFKKRAKT